MSIRARDVCLKLINIDICVDSVRDAHCVRRIATYMPHLFIVYEKRYAFDASWTFIARGKRAAAKHNRQFVSIVRRVTTFSQVTFPIVRNAVIN